MTGDPLRLTLVGAGRMGAAMLAGWLDRGIAPSSVTVLDPAPSVSLSDLCSAKGVRLNPPLEGLEPAEAMVVAVKPQAFDAAAAGVAAAARGALVISIMAGKTIADIRRRLPEAACVIRCMPNTPAALRKGITGMVAEASADPAQRKIADDLLSAVGEIAWLDDEGLMNAVTAISGSGPAYVFHLVECLAAAGSAMGLSPDLAARLARATVTGAGALLEASPQTEPRDLRLAVTSPGGTTAAAMAVLGAEDDGLAVLIRRAAEAARRRGEQLSG